MTFVEQGETENRWHEGGKLQHLVAFFFGVFLKRGDKLELLTNVATNRTTVARQNSEQLSNNFEVSKFFRVNLQLFKL